MSYPTCTFTDVIGSGGTPVTVPAGGAIRATVPSRPAGPSALLIETTVATPLSTNPVMNVYQNNTLNGSQVIPAPSGTTVAALAYPGVGTVEIVNLDPTNSFTVAMQWAAFS